MGCAPRTITAGGTFGALWSPCNLQQKGLSPQGQLHARPCFCVSCNSCPVLRDDTVCGMGPAEPGHRLPHSCPVRRPARSGTGSYGAGECRGSRAPDNAAVDIFPDDAVHGAHGRCDNGRAAGKRFKCYDAEALVQRRHGKNIGCAVIQGAGWAALPGPRTAQLRQAQARGSAT